MTDPSTMASHLHSAPSSIPVAADHPRSRQGRHRHTAILLTAVLLPVIALLSACSGGGNSGGTEAGPTNMTPGVAQMVTSGNRLVPAGNTPAVIEVRHDLATSQRYVTLMEGNAELLR